MDERLNAAVTRALVNGNLTTYVDENQDIIDGLLSEVVEVAVQAVLAELAGL